MTQYVKLTVNNFKLNNSLSEIATTDLIDNSNANISSELSTSTINKNNLTASISIETSRAINSEVILGSSISTQTSRGTSEASRLSSLISTETSRAIGEGLKLSNNISIETSRAKISETSLLNTISTETSRAISEGTKLSSNISIATSRAINVETSISTYLSTFVSGADTSINTVFEIAKALLDDDRTVSNVVSVIGVEVTRATSQETLLSQKLFTHNTNTLNSNNTVSSAISSETTRAVSAESSLSNSISIQTSNNLVTEASLSITISSEISKSNSVETVLSNNISSEIKRAISSETSITTNYTNANNRLQYITTQGSYPQLSAKINLNYGSPITNEVGKIGYTVSGSFTKTFVNFAQVDLFSLNSINDTDTFKLGTGVWLISCTVNFTNVNSTSNSHERCIVISLTSADKSARYRVTANAGNRASQLEEFSAYLPVAPGLRYSDREFDSVNNSGLRQKRTVSGCYVNSSSTEKALYINIGQSVEFANQTFRYDASYSATRIA